jgi:hypothetical protein
MFYTFAADDGSNIGLGYGETGPEPAVMQVRASSLAEMIHELRPDLTKEGVAVTITELLGTWHTHEPYRSAEDWGQ